MIQQFELDPAKKKPVTYSKGNRQKVALIAAFSSDAELYIFDEPTSGLDPLMEEVFQQQVLALKQAGKSVLLSSHILSEVERMCDRIAIIRQGTIIEVGSLSEMRQLSRSTVHVTTQQPLAAIADWPTVHQFTASTPTQAVFAVDAEAMGQVMATLSQLGIVALTTTPPTLEDLFLRYYNSEAGHDDESLR